MSDVRTLVVLAGFALWSFACGNHVEADPAPPVATSIPSGATSAEVPSVVLRATPAPPRPPGSLPPPIAPAPPASPAVSGITSAAASGTP